MNKKLYTALMIVLMLSILGIFTMATLSIPFSWVTGLLTILALGSAAPLVAHDFTVATKKPFDC